VTDITVGFTRVQQLRQETAAVEEMMTGAQQDCCYVGSETPHNRGSSINSRQVDFKTDRTGTNNLGHLNQTARAVLFCSFVGTALAAH